MISLTGLSGSAFALNSDLVERVDSTPDTVITLVDGKKYVVSETLEQVVDTIRRHRAEIIALSGHLQVTLEPEHTAVAVPPVPAPSGRPPLTVVDGREVSPR